MFEGYIYNYTLANWYLSKGSERYGITDSLMTTSCYVRAFFRSNISNTRDCVSSGYPNTEKRVFLTKFKVFG